jgi:hypothetical protein
VAERSAAEDGGRFGRRRARFARSPHLLGTAPLQSAGVRRHPHMPGECCSDLYPIPTCSISPVRKARHLT